MSATLDTLAVVRALGAREVARAVSQRIFRPRREELVLPTPADVARAALSFRVAPSPLSEDDDEQRLRTLERELPGICTRIRERGQRAAVDVEAALSRPCGEPCLDPRLAWEPHRLGRLVAIGIGARVARSAAEASDLRAAFERGVLAWLESHPYAGAADDSDAWASPLEVALRAWNLWIAASFVRTPMLSPVVVRELGRTMLLHGRLVEARLEDRGLVVGTHLLGEVVGLYACGTALSAAGGEPGAWRALARRRLETEVPRQILADGGGAEGSTGYTRFVFELLLAAFACSRARGERPPPAIVAAARSVGGFLLATMTPSGGDPGIGDDDDSQLLPPGQREARDVAALAPFPSALLGVRERPEGLPWSEEAAWLTGAEGHRLFTRARAVAWTPCWTAPDFGLALARRGGRDGDCVTLRAGPHGQRGAGGHAHNDPLSVTIWLGGRPIVVDPGTGVYLGRRAVRDRFRGVAAHAAVAVDRREPSPIPRTRPFALPDVSHARLVATGDDGQGWGAAAEHQGYLRIGVHHRREVRFERDGRRVVLVDQLESIRPGGEREIALTFPLGPAESELVGGRVRIGPAEAAWAWLEREDDVDLPWRLDRAPVSPRYGTITAGWAARRVGRVQLPVKLVTVVRTEP